MAISVRKSKITKLMVAISLFNISYEVPARDLAGYHLLFLVALVCLGDFAVLCSSCHSLILITDLYCMVLFSRNHSPKCKRKYTRFYLKWSLNPSKLFASVICIRVFDGSIVSVHLMIGEDVEHGFWFTYCWCGAIVIDIIVLFKSSEYLKSCP